MLLKRDNQTDEECLLCGEIHGTYSLICEHRVKAPCNDGIGSKKIMWCPTCATGVKVFSYASPTYTWTDMEEVQKILGKM